jgi:steroid 5-alpha reductase family enzyme
VNWTAFGVDAGVTLLFVWALLTATFAVALRVGRHAIIDVVWGGGFVVVAVVSLLLARRHGVGDLARGLLVVGLVAVWGVRLAAHITRRNAGRGEDPRYADIAGRARRSVAVHMYRRVYLTQAAALWFVSLPVQLAAHQDGPLWSGASAVLVVVGALVWAGGLFFEAVGDWQLARFTADPANEGKINDRGLWRYTRHPNYFGDACVWWGLFLLTAWTWRGWAFVLSPLLMTWTLARGTGAPLTEKRMASTRRGFADYVESTSGFLPLPPRRRIRPAGPAGGAAGPNCG